MWELVEVHSKVSSAEIHAGASVHSLSYGGGDLTNLLIIIVIEKQEEVMVSLEQANEYTISRRHYANRWGRTFIVYVDERLILVNHPP